MNRDFVEMLSALSAAKADYLIVGAHALAAHGVVRATGDLDIWVRATKTNAQRVWSALITFGAPLDKTSAVARIEVLRTQPKPASMVIAVTNGVMVITTKRAVRALAAQFSVSRTSFVRRRTPRVRD